MLVAAVLLFGLAPARAALPCGPFSGEPLPAPAPRLAASAVARAEAITAEAQAAPHAVVFLGDSLTQFWDQQIWQQHYAPLGALNAGVSGDLTEHLMWRLDHGNLAGPPPHAIVLLIGTNDLGRDRPPAVTAEGVRRILSALRDRLPRTRILLLGLLPRGRSPQGRLRQLIAEVNRLIRSCADGRNIVYLDLGAALLDGDGELPPAVSPDRLHLSAAGYQLIAPRLDASLARLLAASN